MLYYILFWTLMGFIIHFHIIFRTNLLTGGPAQNCCFPLFQYFEETEYQTESKRNKTFGNVIFSPNVIQETWTLLQGVKEAVTRVGGAPTPLGRAPCLVGPSMLHRRTPSSYIYLRTPKRSNTKPKNLISPSQLSVSTRSHLGACSGAPPERAVITEVFYIIIAPPMKCE